MKKGKLPLWKVVLYTVLGLVGVALCGFVFLAVLLTVTEYRPADIEPLSVNGSSEQKITAGRTHRVLTWNIGYGALGDNADFFLDGGTGVKTADKERVDANLSVIKENIGMFSPDLVLLQEVDVDSHRSEHTDEAAFLVDDFVGNSSFAYNYKSLFIPYPLPPIGRVNAGILTLSSCEITEAERVQLPCPFTWIERLGNLKRCLLVTRLPVEGTEKELVLVNLHLEAYDSGEGKAAQTKLLREYLETEEAAGNYVIAGGDFNQIFSGVDDSAFPVYEGRWKPGAIEESDFSERFSLLMDEETPSCRSLDQPYAGASLEEFQYYIIDGFIVSDNVEVQTLKTVDLGFAASDHNPVVMEFSLKR